MVVSFCLTCFLFFLFFSPKKLIELSIPNREIDSQNLCEDSITKVHILNIEGPKEHLPMLVLTGYKHIVLALLCFLYVNGHWRRHRNSLITNWPIVGMVLDFLEHNHRPLQYTTKILKRDGEAKGPCFSNIDTLIACDLLNIQGPYAIGSRNSQL